MRKKRRLSLAASAVVKSLLVLLLLVATRDVAGQPEGDDDDVGPTTTTREPDGDAASSPSIDEDVHRLPSHALVSSIRGSPRWKLLPDLFTRRTALVTCDGGSDFRVYVARDEPELARNVAQRSSPPAWCGWRRAAARAARGALLGRGRGTTASSSGWWLLSSLPSPVSSRLLSSPPPSESPSSSLPPCEARLPTFGPSAVAVLPPTARPSFRPDERCTVSESQSFDPSLPARLALGTTLFVLAPSLSSSATFRVSAGAVAFAAASALVVLFVVARAVPNKRALAAVAAATGSGFFTLARLLFGHWVPTLSELLSAKVLGSYAFCSLAVGAAVAFWFDDPEAAKAHAILRAALRLAGLALVAGGVSSTEAGVALALALALSGVLASGGWWGRLLEERRRRRGTRGDEREGGERKATTAATTRVFASPPSPPRGRASSPTETRYESAEDEGGGEDAPSSSHGGGGNGGSLPRRRSLAASPPQAGATAAERSASRSPTGAAGPLFRRFSFRGFGGGGGGGVAAAAPPARRPPLVSSAAAVPLPGDETEREEEEEQGREGEEEEEGEEQRLGWQREVRRPQPQQQRRTAAASTPPPPAPTSLPLRSPLVDRGLLLNEATGKTIKIGAATYNRLVLEGFTVDERRGTLSPPVRGGGRAAARQQREEEERGGGSRLRPRTRGGGGGG